MRRMLEQTFGGSDGEAWAPLVDIEEQDDAYVLEVEVPGVKREDVNVEQIGNELVISGEIKEQERKGIVRRKARRVGRFAYRVMLPERVDHEQIQAKLNDGVLDGPRSEVATGTAPSSRDHVVTSERGTT